MNCFIIYRYVNERNDGFPNIRRERFFIKTKDNICYMDIETLAVSHCKRYHRSALYFGILDFKRIEGGK